MLLEVLLPPEALFRLFAEAQEALVHVVEAAAVRLFLVLAVFPLLQLGVDLLQRAGIVYLRW